MTNYFEKYIKYKNKYIELQKTKASNQSGGSSNIDESKTNIILFKADWCGHCKAFKPTWDEIKKKYSSKYNIVTFDANKNEDKIGDYGITGYPTIKIQNKDTIVEYNGERTINDIIEFAKTI